MCLVYGSIFACYQGGAFIAYNSTKDIYSHMYLLVYVYLPACMCAEPSSELEVVKSCRGTQL